MTLHFGDGSSISTFASLPAIDGSALTGISGIIVDAATGTQISEQNNRYGSNVISISVTPTASSQKVLIICNCEIKNQNGGYATYARIDTTNGSDTGDQRYTFRFGASNNAYNRHTFVEYDYASNTSTRTYKLYIYPNNSHTSTKAYYKNCTLTALVFQP